MIGFLNDKVSSTVRHWLGGIGAGLVGLGWASQEDVAVVLTSYDDIVGGVMFIVAWALGVFSKDEAPTA